MLEIAKATSRNHGRNIVLGNILGISIEKEKRNTEIFHDVDLRKNILEDV